VWIGPSEDSEMVITAGRDATIRVWDLHTGTLCRTLEGHTQEVVSIIVTDSTLGRSRASNRTVYSNGNSCNSGRPMIISSSCDESVRIWDLDRMIRDMKWVRRKDFAVLYSQLTRLYDEETNQLTPRMNNICSILTVPDIRQAIASYL
jgi:WD40 repeat protein